MSRILSALNRRRRLLMILAAFSLLVIAGAAFWHWYNRGSILDFVDMDLRKLDDKPRTLPEKVMAHFFPDEVHGPRSRLNSILKRTLPGEFKPDRYSGFKP